jgi:hypothetical protein
LRTERHTEQPRKSARRLEEEERQGASFSSDRDEGGFPQPSAGEKNKPSLSPLPPSPLRARKTQHADEQQQKVLPSSSNPRNDNTPSLRADLETELILRSTPLSPPSLLSFSLSLSYTPSVLHNPTPAHHGRPSKRQVSRPFPFHLLSLSALPFREGCTDGALPSSVRSTSLMPAPATPPPPLLPSLTLPSLASSSPTPHRPTNPKISTPPSLPTLPATRPPPPTPCSTQVKERLDRRGREGGFNGRTAVTSRSTLPMDPLLRQPAT